MSNWPNGSRSTRLRRQARRAIPRHCAACGTDVDLQLDHVVNLAEGGTDTLDNLQYMCRTHHDIKTQAERQRGIDRARAQRGSLSRKYRALEPHPGADPR
jgi:5-methylcytosine-specific restriction protein A